MKKDKPTFITIIILLIIFVPMSIYGTIGYIQSKQYVENPNHDQYYDGYVYFYKNDEMLGKYKCKTDKCYIAQSSIDTENINYPEGSKKELGIVKDKYTFIQDGESVYLYDIYIDRDVFEFDSIKFYNSTIEGDNLLVEKDSKWGIFSLENISMTIPYSFQYLGLPNKLIDNKVQMDKLIVKEKNEYYLIDSDTNTITQRFNNVIYDYNKNYVITNVNGEFKFNDYQANPINYFGFIDNIILTDNYVALIYKNNVKIYKDVMESTYSTFQILESDKLTLVESENSLNIYLNGELYKTI